MKLIDAHALRRAMYHEAFETDSPMQKWDGGCWIRYKMFERAIDAAPIIPQKILKYTGESICLTCQTSNCDGCICEPMTWKED